MKKIQLTVFQWCMAFVLVFASTSVIHAQNLIPDWDANGATGAGTEANKWGWAASTGGTDWQTAGGGGVRFRDLTDIAIDTGGTFTGREFMYRWEGSYVGSTLSLGLPDDPGNTTVQNGIPLTGGTAYAFDGLFLWVNNGGNPTYEFAISDAPSGGNVLVSKSYSISVKNRYYPVNLLFKPTTTGDYYLQVTQTGGLTGSGAGGLMGLAGSTLEEFTSSDATLSDIALSTGSLDPAFDPATVSYSVDLPYGTTSVDVTATPTIELSEVVGDGTIDVSSGTGDTDIMVTAIDGTTKTYALNFAVDPGDTLATLSDIALSEGSLDPAFDLDVLSYQVDLANSVNSVDVTATPTVPDADVSGDGPIDVSSGSGTATIVVTATNTTTTKTYTVNFTKLASTDATLSDISFDFGYLKGVFDSGTTTYEVLVPAGASTVNVTATKSDATATIESGDGAIDVSGGSTSTVINVTAEDGTTTEAYTIDFTVDPINYMFGWDGDGHTGAGSKPNNFGWENTAGDAAWVEANGSSGCRYRDDPGGYTYEDGGAAVTGRQFLLRYDGSTASETSAFTYPVVLEANSAYEFSFDYVYGGSGTAPATLTAGIGTSNDVTSEVASKGFETASSTTKYRSGSLVFMTDAAGVYYVKFTCSEKSWQGVNNLSLEEFTSSDATLSDIALSAGTLEPAFDPALLSYDVDLPYGTTSVDVTGIPTIEVSDVVGDGTIDVSSGNGATDIVVTAIDGTTKTYAVNFAVDPGDTLATLSDIALSEGSLDPEFDPDVLSYQVDVANSVNSVDVTATPTVPGADVSGDGPIDVSSGSGTATIVVTAANGSDTRTYTINFTRLPVSADATLSNISFDFGYLKGVFDSGTDIYDVLVPAGASTVNVTATKSYEYATIKSGDGAINVSGGNTSTVINVTAEDGTTTGTYTLNFIVDATNHMFGWDGDGLTGTGSEPNNFGWESTSGSIPWKIAHSTSGARFRDYNVTNGHTGYTNESDGSTSTTRQFLLRWDNDGYMDAYYTFPVTLAANTVYQFSLDHLLGGSASAPGTLTVGVGATTDGTSLLKSESFQTTSDLKIYRNSSMLFKTDTAGTYFMTFSGTRAWYGVTNLVLEEFTSSDATLSDLTVDAGTLDPVFDPGTTSYNVLLPPGSDALIIAATPTIEFSEVTGAGTVDVSAGNGTAIVTVTSMDGSTTQDYTIDWEVEFISSDATLSDLSVDGGHSLSPTFSPEITSYTVSYDYTVDAVNITAVQNYPAATVTGDTEEFVLSDGAVATITVTAENGSTRDYTITFKANLIPLWDGDGITGEGSEANKWGWASSTGGTDWQQANQLGVRFRDMSNVATETGGTFTGREFLYRWEGTYEGSTLSLGIPDDPGNTTVQNGILLTGGKYYSFDGLFEWINNANSPTYEFAISDEASGGNIIASKSYSISTKEKYYPVNILFEIPSTGDYYIQVTQTGGVTGSAGGLIGLADLTLEEFTSSDATLSDIVLSAGTLDPAFDPAIISYDVDLPYGTTSVDVTATPTIEVSDVVGDGTIDVSSGTGAAEIVVTAIDGETNKTYTVNFAVNPGDTLATLSDIALSAGSLDPVFDPDVLAYTVDVPFSVNSVDVTATPTVSGASVSGDGPIDVSSGSGTATIEVTAIDENTTKTYTVNFTRLPVSTDATLSDVSFDFGYLKGVFDSGTSTYEVLVPAGVSTVNVTAETSHEYATIDSGDGAIDVSGGNTSTMINVTAEDGSTTAAYTVNFTVDPTNYMFGWDSDGHTGAGSEPNNFGWQCTVINNSTGWTEANVFGVRFQDDVSYTYDGGSLTGRVMWARWDGVSGTSTESIYAYPVSLEAGFYRFTSMMAWHSDASVPDYSYQFNSMPDNTGTTLDSDIINVPNTGELHDIQLLFEVESAGTYYFTLESSTGVLGAITELSLEATPDTDGDGIPDVSDNCPETANADQADLDGDEVGDFCDEDRDGDGVLNEEDAFPDDPEEDTDTDGDGVGDNADTDDDGDGQLDADEESCGSDPLDADSKSDDLDNDGVPDCVDTDDDGDGISDEEDNCPVTANPDQEDADGDGIGDACQDDVDDDGIANEDDNCPETANADQEDLDGDGIGDVCDDDMDGDGIANGDDNCPKTANAGQEDLDEDGIGNACDDDMDGDGIANEDDNCPGTPNADQEDTDGDGIGDACQGDMDGDGIADEEDNCPDTPNPGQEDLDEDGLGDACDDSVAMINLSGTLEFGELAIGESATSTFTISNNGSVELEVSEITAVDGFTSEPATATIAGGESAEITVTFSPSEAKTYAGVITVKSNMGDATIDVSGTGIEDALGLDPVAGKVSFGPNPVRDQLTINWSGLELNNPTLMIYDLNGKIHWQGIKLPGTKVEVDMKGLSEGMFLLHIYGGEQPIIQKLIKKN